MEWGSSWGEAPWMFGGHALCVGGKPNKDWGLNSQWSVSDDVMPIFSRLCQFWVHASWQEQTLGWLNVLEERLSLTGIVYVLWGHPLSAQRRRGGKLECKCYWDKRTLEGAHLYPLWPQREVEGGVVKKKIRCGLENSWNQVRWTYTECVKERGKQSSPGPQVGKEELKPRNYEQRNCVVLLKHLAWCPLKIWSNL